MVQEELKSYSTEIILSGESFIEWQVVYKKPLATPKMQKPRPAPIGSNHLSLTITNLT
jgi:hypothetical protein